MKSLISNLKSHPLLWITALAAALRLPTLSLESFWYDETFTAWLANLPISNLLAATLGDVHPPTWYLIEWGVARALGTSEFSLRLVSALAGVALVPAVYRLSVLTLERSTFNLPTLPQARTAQPSNAPTLAALITAVAPFGIYYSQEARPYSLLMLACTLAAIGLLERRWWLLILCSSLALYLHNLAVLYVAALVWLGLYRWRLEWRMAASFLAIGMIWSPWLVFGLLHQVSDVQNGFWVRPPNAGTPAYILSNLFFMESGFIAVNTGLMAGLLLVQVDWRKQLELTGLVVVCLGLGVILSVLIAPVLIIRVMAPLAPVLYALIAPVLSRHRLIASLALATALTWFAAYTLSDHVGRPPALQNLQALITNLQPADGLFHGNLASYITMHYYLPNAPQVVWKQANDLSQSLTGETKAAMQMDQASFESVACTRPRWWIITASNPTTSAAERRYLQSLITNYQAVQHAVIEQGPLVDARLWLVDTRLHCPQLTEVNP